MWWAERKHTGGRTGAPGAPSQPKRTAPPTDSKTRPEGRHRSSVRPQPGYRESPSVSPSCRRETGECQVQLRHKHVEGLHVVGKLPETFSGFSHQVETLSVFVKVALTEQGPFSTETRPKVRITIGEKSLLSESPSHDAVLHSRVCDEHSLPKKGLSDTIKWNEMKDLEHFQIEHLHPGRVWFDENVHVLATTNYEGYNGTKSTPVCFFHIQRGREKHVRFLHI